MDFPATATNLLCFNSSSKDLEISKTQSISTYLVVLTDRKERDGRPLHHDWQIFPFEVRLPFQYPSHLWLKRTGCALSVQIPIPIPMFHCHMEGREFVTLCWFKRCGMRSKYRSGLTNKCKRHNCRLHSLCPVWFSSRFLVLVVCSNLPNCSTLSYS